MTFVSKQFDGLALQCLGMSWGFFFNTRRLAAAVAGAFICILTACGSGSGSPGSTAPVAPAITAQPTSQTVTNGQTATFTVAASGTAPLSYQWKKGTSNISGATAASYTTPATQPADNSAQFTVSVSNAAGSVTSSAATLTVNSAPAITTQPSNQSVSEGQTATFTVTASGTAPLSYQWQKASVSITGATSASYTTPATTPTDNSAQFQVIVSNSLGSVTSSAATLTVNASPSITTQPSNQTVAVGQTATFAVIAAGAAPLSYQWQKNGANISGATSASYITPVTTSADSGSQFKVTVSNSAGSVTSNVATLTVNTAPAIVTQPASQTVAVGQTATFTLVAAGAPPLSYQWQKNGANISGATSANYTTPATTSGDSGSQFKVTVTNSAGSVTSSAATLTVDTPPSITTQPSNQTVNVGSTATFTVVAAGTAPLSYQWGKGGVNISGATSASYTTPATSSTDNNSQFQVKVSNPVGTVTSAVATLTVNTPLSITTQPANQTVTTGLTASFTVVAAGTAPLSYQWQKNSANISGATSATYITPAVALSDSGSRFDVIVSNSLGSVTSNTVTLTVGTAFD
ncbi:MAG TPA: immunoglobulin domain-containing protein, partial [Candidatus Sulfotelmatobacter sp.]